MAVDKGNEGTQSRIRLSVGVGFADAAGWSVPCECVGWGVTSLGTVPVVTDLHVKRNAGGVRLKADIGVCGVRVRHQE